VVGLGNDDVSDAETLRASYRIASKLPRCIMHVVHAITPSQASRSPGDSNLERLDQSLLTERERIQSLVRRTLGALPGSPEIHIDVVFDHDREQALDDAAKRHAATLLVLHAHGNSRSASLPAELIERAPCSVLVVRPRRTPLVAEPLVEPPPEPGETLRTQNAISKTHVVVPSESRERKQGFSDITGPF
jgi:nucleotide-binding universal stress UspA family protein